MDACYGSIMINTLTDIISKNEVKDFKEILALIVTGEQRLLLRNDVLLAFRQYCDKNNKTKRFREKSSVFGFLHKVQEAFIHNEHILIMHRLSPARYRFYLLRCDGERIEEIDVSHYLNLKDSFIQIDHGSCLQIDFMPFYDYTPSIKDSRTIGNGINFLNRFMCSSLFQNPEKWNARLFEFIKLHKHQEQQLLVNSVLLPEFNTFFNEMEKTIEWLNRQKPDTPFARVEQRMKKSGFEPGWGNTAGRIGETMQMLVDLINEPTSERLERFISRIPLPLISKIAIVSPHGWFGQENVLGRPDTGGQVIYVLDQVRALEKHLQHSIALTGLSVKPTIIVITRLIPDAGDTTCNQKTEKILNTDNGWILRIPFRDKNNNIIPQWIPRFHVWPYLEGFADDAAGELTSAFKGRPDFIIGNYSDGNLVATLLSDRLDVVQCTIAHALEKTKYLFSDLYWQEMETDYNFSLQFTADLLAMNKSDFIIASTHQEIVGTEDTMGQYESYQTFSLPGLYQVKNGINLFAPKFNVIPPGVDESIYFPYYINDQRITTRTTYWEKRLFTDNTPDIFGTLDDPHKPPIFTMSRLDKIKNITGLIEAFGLSKKIRKRFNLVFASGSIHIEDSLDHEERQGILKIHELIDHYSLHNQIRWLPGINKLDTGEVYRIMAERKGIFVQPALFEAFGLTILEAMLSGLPTFATQFGGPAEIIEDGINGYLINPSQSGMIARRIEYFMQGVDKDPGLWDRISRAGIKRVQDDYNWRLYSERLISLAKIYGFWRYSVSGQGKIKMSLYCDFLYHFLIKQRAMEREAPQG